MHVEVRAYAMPRAVEIVHSLTPHIHASKGIELCAACPIREFQHGKLDVSLEHQRIDPALFLRDRTESYRAGDVCCGILILCSAVKKQETLWTQRGIRLWSCFIMHYGTVRLIAGYGVKTDVTIQRLLRTQ